MRCPICEKGTQAAKVWTKQEWEHRRSQLPDERLCPCDDHPPEKCEACRGACSCHFDQSAVLRTSEKGTE